MHIPSLEWTQNGCDHILKNDLKRVQNVARTLGDVHRALALAVSDADLRTSQTSDSYIYIVVMIK